MSKGDTFENDFVKLIFQASAIANIADNAATSPLTNLYLSLHTADPGEAGSQTTSEATYTSYARVAVARTSGWKLADLTQIDADSRHYVEFSFRLDTTQLPGPMHIGLTTQADWELSIERTVRVD